MSRLLSPLAGAAFAVALLAAPVARAADEPKDILEKAIKAHGGADALTKNKAVQLKAKGKLDIPGVGEVEYSQETAFMIPDKFKDSMEFTVAGQNISVLTLIKGDDISIEVNGKAIDIGDNVKDAIKEIGHILEVGRLVPLLDKKYELSLIGEDKVEGKKVVGIRVSAKKLKDVSMYFDKETSLLAKIEFRTVDVTTGNEVNEERIVTEYAKNKAGVPVPKTVIVKRDGKNLLNAEVTEYNMLEKLDDSDFKK
jgi:hypothetical protein